MWRPMCYLIAKRSMPKRGRRSEHPCREAHFALQLLLNALGLIGEKLTQAVGAEPLARYRGGPITIAAYE